MSVQWQGREQILVKMALYGNTVIDTVGGVADYHAPIIEADMKATASWRDRSGNARQGLHAERVEGKGVVAIVMWHTMDYGKWLEVRFSGRYAILWPSVLRFAPRVFKMLREVFK